MFTYILYLPHIWHDSVMTISKFKTFTMKKIFLSTGIVTLMLYISSCGGNRGNNNDGNLMNTDTISGTDTEKTGVMAFAQLSPASGSNATGSVTFEETNDGVRITVQATGISPGKHALHLHENGDCSAPDATSAGGHWNPTNMPHGKRGSGQFHKGDIDNVEAKADSSVNYEEEIEGWTIGGPDSTNILNKAVILHQGADDFKSQPSGDAGSRIACGVIKEQ